ncbi:uncharacterized protein Hap1MRO34_021414 [Clarias gariepinus]
MLRTMSRTDTTTGFLSVYISAVVLLHCPSHTPAHSTMEISQPTIIKINTKQTVRDHRLTCLVNPGGLMDETMVYWLADGDFLEEKYKKFDVKNTERKSSDGTVLLHSKVLLQDLTAKDLSTNFTCVALSPAGFDKRTVQLKKEQRKKLADRERLALVKH